MQFRRIADIAGMFKNLYLARGDEFRRFSSALFPENPCFHDDGIIMDQLRERRRNLREFAREIFRSCRELSNREAISGWTRNKIDATIAFMDI